MIYHLQASLSEHQNDQYLAPIPAITGSKYEQKAIYQKEVELSDFVFPMSVQLSQL